MKFEWDDEKAQSNYAKHRVAFEEAVEVFLDPLAVEAYDESHSDEEDRYRRIGLSSRRLLFVVYVERRGDAYRLISARKANQGERNIYEQG
jgi:uncharacterized protein